MFFYVLVLREQNYTFFTFNCLFQYLFGNINMKEHYKREENVTGVIELIEPSTFLNVIN